MQNYSISIPHLKTGKAFLMSGLFIGLSACATQADRASYMGFECEQLRMLSEAHGPLDPFAANKVGPEPQAGLSGDREGLKTESIARTEERDEETRAIRTAYRNKGC